MSIFDDANDEIFNSELAIDAIYRPAGGSDLAVRVVPLARDIDLQMASAAMRTAEHLFDLRASEVPSPLKGDQLVVETPVRFAGTFEINEKPKAMDAERSIFRLFCVRAVPIA